MPADILGQTVAMLHEAHPSHMLADVSEWSVAYGAALLGTARYACALQRMMQFF